MAVVGPGLLGGSVLLSIQKRKPTEVFLSAWSRREESLTAIHHSGALQFGTTEIAQLFSNPDQSPDLVILATPIGYMPDLARRIAESATGPLVITDVGSTKGTFVDELETIFAEKPGLEFVSSHPMAGSEKTGFEFAEPDLFQDRVCILTPTEKTDPSALQRVDHFWKELGSKTFQLSPAVHDRVVAKISHVPHITAAALVLAGLDEGADKIPTGDFAANGFKDTTRIAGGDPDMWTEILLENRLSISDSLRFLIEELETVHHALENGDESSLHKFLATAKTLRDSLGDPL